MSSRISFWERRFSSSRNGKDLPGYKYQFRRYEVSYYLLSHTMVPSIRSVLYPHFLLNYSPQNCDMDPGMRNLPDKKGEMLPRVATITW